jgi:hypothetical protein
VPWASQLEAQPLHGVLDAVDVLLLFLLGVGVVEAQVAHAAVVARQPKFRQMLLAWPTCR